MMRRVEVARAASSSLMRRRPMDRAELRGWVRVVLGIDVPDTPRCATHRSPMDYLEHAFFERGDALIWANRGGGKTFYGAVATLLDLVFKPGIEVRILGGSFDQSAKMHAYLRRLIDRPMLRPWVAGRVTARGVRLRNGSGVELLCASQTSVRGQRVQKLRCDEVELFRPELWEAAQFVTRSARCGDVDVRGSVEALSTMHQPFGMMSRLIETAESTGTTVMRWCGLDVLDRCEPARPCASCGLADACRGRAKRWRGFLSVNDALSQLARSSRSAFASEMLCERPSRSDAVYAAFDPAVHVRAVEGDASLTWVGGMDFGMRSPLVMLWAQLRDTPAGTRVEVIDEYVRGDRTVAHHLEVIDGRDWPRPIWLGVDPAGSQRSSHSGRSTIDLLRRAGFRVRARRARLIDGVERVRQLIDPAQGEPRLVVHPRCRRLIESLTAYHFDPLRPHAKEPVKDGHDHAVDALRYLAMNLDGAAREVKVRGY